MEEDACGAAGEDEDVDAALWSAVSTFMDETAAFTAAMRSLTC